MISNSCLLKYFFFIRDDAIGLDAILICFVKHEQICLCIVKKEKPQVQKMVIQEK